MSVSYGFAATTGADMPAPRLLAAHADGDVLQRLGRLLEPEGIRVQTVASPAAIVDALDATDADVVLLDAGTALGAAPDGCDLVSRLHAEDPTISILVMAAPSDEAIAETALTRGARELVPQPWDDRRLVACVRLQVALARTLRRLRRVETENRRLYRDACRVLTAESPAMRGVVDLVARVASTQANVLITGEPGTGKTTVARALHAHSPRWQQLFVTCRMRDLSAEALARELFGATARAGAAIGDQIGALELADGGTLFLDEIAALPRPAQTPLLRAIESREFVRIGSTRTRRVDVRVVSAAAERLDREVAAGRFDADLRTRVTTVEIPLPPLRQRREDVLPLASEFLQRHVRRHRKPLTGFESSALKALVDYDWPGNLRELDAAVERAVVVAEPPLVRTADLRLAPASAQAPQLQGLSLEDVERDAVRQALKRHDGNVSRAARALGLSRSALYRRLQRYGV